MGSDIQGGFSRPDDFNFAAPGIRMLSILPSWDMGERVDVSDLFALRLARRGFDIDWVMLSSPFAGSWKKTVWRNQTAYMVGKGGNAGMAGKLFGKMNEFLGMLKLIPVGLAGKYDVVQARDTFYAAVIGLMIARLKRIPFVFWLSYPFPEARLLDAKEKRSRHPWYSRWMGHTTSWLLYRIILPYADHAFVQSEQMKRDIMAHGIAPEKMTAVPMGVADEVFARQSGEAIAGTVIYLGTLARVRRLEVLLHAMVEVIKKAPQARLIFVGNGDAPEDRQFLEDEVQRLGLEKVVTFTGFLPMDDAWKMVESAAICVSPFYPTPVLRSTSPTKIIEYMALGKPVVANDHPEQSRIIQESGAGLCVEWSAEAFANAIIQLISQPEQSTKMGQLGPGWVKQNRSYERIADLVFDRYQTILSRTVI